MYLLADIGGTKTKIGLSKNTKNIYKKFIFDTLKDYSQFLEFIKRYKNLKIKKACFGFPGVFDKNKEKLLKAPNLKDFENKNLKRDLEKILDCKVILENDALLAGLGEAEFGAGKNYKIFGYLTISTGIGGAKIVNKKIEDNVFGFEPGHSFLIFNLDNFTEVENIISGRVLEETFKTKPKNIKEKNFWREYELILSLFLINVSLFWSVNLIIIGGSISQSLNFKNLNFLVNKFHPLPIQVKILKSKLKNFSGLYGCLLKIKEML